MSDIVPIFLPKGSFHPRSFTAASLITTAEESVENSLEKALPFIILISKVLKYS